MVIFDMICQSSDQSCPSGPILKLIEVLNSFLPDNTMQTPEAKVP